MLTKRKVEKLNSAQFEKRNSPRIETPNPSAKWERRLQACFEWLLPKNYTFIVCVCEFENLI